MTADGVVTALSARLAARPAPPDLEGVVYLFRLTGAAGGTFHVVIYHGRGRVQRGEPQGRPPHCTVTMDTDDAVALIAGRLNPVTAFITRKIRVADGGMALARRLGELLR